MHESNNKSDECADDGINSTVRLSRTGVDRYYNNAALIFPTKRTRSGSVWMSDSSVIDTESAAIRQNVDEKMALTNHFQTKSRKTLFQRMRAARKNTKLQFDVFVDFMEPHKRTIWKKFWGVMVCVMMETKLFFWNSVALILFLAILRTVVHHGAHFDPCWSPLLCLWQPTHRICTDSL